MKIGFIGAGKVGKALGLFLKNAGIEITGYYSRSDNSAITAAELTKSNSYKNLQKLIEDSDIIGITTPDDAIEAISNNLAGIKINWQEKTTFHMSGVNSSELLNSLGSKGATTLSLHPMMSFAINPIKASTDISEAIFTIEGTGKYYYRFKSLLEQIGVQVIQISTKDKAAYHAAASMISNYTVTLLDIGKRLFLSIGFTEEQASKLAEPLVKNTINNVFDFGTEQALTGPISRGDLGTVVKHIENLTNYNKRITEIYRMLGFETAELALRGGKINEELVIRLKEVLSNE